MIADDGEEARGYLRARREVGAAPSEDNLEEGRAVRRAGRIKRAIKIIC